MFEKKNTLLLLTLGVLACLLMGVCLLFGLIYYRYHAGSSPNSTAAPAAGSPQSTQESQPGFTLPGMQPSPTPAASPTPTGPNPIPVSLQKGLASLNSYRTKIHMLTTGPKATDYSETTTTNSYILDGKKLYSKEETISSTEKEPTRKTSISETYRLNKKSCQLSTSADGDTSVDVTDISPLEQTMTDILAGLWDVNISAKDPKFIDTALINGIQTNHFRFQVSGLNSDGAEVTQSQGEYWIAQDGQYLVKYQVTLEIHSGATDAAKAEVNHFETQIELSDINVPFQLELPTSCNK